MKREFVAEVSAMKGKYEKQVEEKMNRALNSAINEIKEKVGRDRLALQTQLTASTKQKQILLEKSS